MGMQRYQEQHIREQLEKRFHDLTDDIDEGGASRTYQKCYDVYNAMNGSPEDWVLMELMDADTLEKKWYWRRKS